MANFLLDALDYVGSSLDKPGRAVRGLLAGRPEEALAAIPFSDALGWTDPANAVSGRDLLQRWGAVGENQEGLDWGDVAGFGAELALDPTNLIGGSALAKLLGVRRAAKTSNAIRDARLATGGMPEEIARLTKAVDASGRPLTTYHGTPHVFDKYDMSKMDTGSLYGPGIYTTADRNVASSYTSKGSTPGGEVLLRPDVPEKDLIDAYWNFHKQKGLDDDELSQIMDNLLDFRESRDYKSFRETMEGLVELASEGFEDTDLIPYLDDLGLLYETAPSPQNVRMQFLNVRRPFEFEAALPADEVARLTAGPGTMRQNTALTGEGLFGSLEADLGSAAAARQRIEDMGYDAIRHVGGRFTGNRPHDVWIAFNPSQIYSPWVAPALRDVPRASPLISALVGQNALARGSGMY